MNWYECGSTWCPAFHYLDSNCWCQPYFDVWTALGVGIGVGMFIAFMIVYFNFRKSKNMREECF